MFARRGTPNYLVCFSRVAVSLLLCGALPHDASAQCTRDYRNVSFSDGSARIRTYLCNAAGTRLRVEFHRFSEVVTGGILMNQLQTASVDNLLETFTVVRNNVHSELELLFQRFGNRSVRHGTDNGFGISIKVDTPRGGLAYTGRNTFFLCR